MRCGADWTGKYCLGLSLEDTGFDFSVLSEFRARLVAGSLELANLDLLLDWLKGLGMVKAGGRQRTDSTHVLARIRGLNQLGLSHAVVIAGQGAGDCRGWRRRMPLWFRMLAVGPATWLVVTGAVGSGAGRAVLTRRSAVGTSVPVVHRAAGGRLGLWRDRRCRRALCGR
jgi:hypothetical protein